MLTLKYKRKNNLTVATQIYNACHKYKTTIKGLRTKMQQPIKCLEDNKYVFKYRTVDELKIVIRIYEVIIKFK